MALENETWLLDVGDRTVERMASTGYSQLSLIEQAIYCLWIVDYAVRNAGDLRPVSDMHPTAIDELEEFASLNKFESLCSVLKSRKNEEEFCESYYVHFEGVCNEFRRLYDAT